MTIDWSKHKCWSADQIRAEVAQERAWGSPIELEVRRRITLSVATYAYEIADKPIMSDYGWDRLAQHVNPLLGTCHPILDEFFVARFSPMTGLWIHDHPELDQIATLFRRYYTGIVREYYERSAQAGLQRRAA